VRPFSAKSCRHCVQERTSAWRPNSDTCEIDVGAEVGPFRTAAHDAKPVVMVRVLLLIVAACALCAPVCAAQGMAPSPPAIWVDAHQCPPPVPNADLEHAGRRSVGDLLAENAYRYCRTARLVSAYTAELDGSRTITFPEGTAFIAMTFLRIAVDPPGGPPQSHQPEAAPGTTHWCALTSDGATHCFFWDVDGGVYLNSNAITNGAPSERALTGGAIRVPPPALIERDMDLPPIRKQVFLESVNADGYVLRTVTSEAGKVYPRLSRRLPWNTWQQTWISAHQRVSATPILAPDGGVEGANVTFSRTEHP